MTALETVWDLYSYQIKTILERIFPQSIKIFERIFPQSIKTIRSLDGKKLSQSREELFQLLNTWLIWHLNVTEFSF